MAKTEFGSCCCEALESAIHGPWLRTIVCKQDKGVPYMCVCRRGDNWIEKPAVFCPFCRHRFQEDGEASRPVATFGPLRRSILRRFKRFGWCCKDFAEAVSSWKDSLFIVHPDDGILRFAIAQQKLEVGSPAWHHDTVYFCPFCGEKLQDKEEVRKILTRR
jgi:hypothetical protein